MALSKTMKIKFWPRQVDREKNSPEPGSAGFLLIFVVVDVRSCGHTIPPPNQKQSVTRSLENMGIFSPRCISIIPFAKYYHTAQLIVKKSQILPLQIELFKVVCDLS